MAIITTGQTFTATGPVTNTKLQDIASAATFNDPVDETSLRLIPTGNDAGKLGVKDGGITPAKLSAGGPEWDANGNLLVSRVVAPESANSLTISSDPEAPDPTDGGPQIKLYSKDSGSTSNQIFHRADFHIFNNQNGIQVAAVPPTLAPTQPQHLVRKDYVDGGGGFTPSSYAGEESVTLPNGFIMKFGTVSSNGGVQSKTFATAFPNACLNLQGQRSGLNDSSHNLSYTALSSAGWTMNPISAGTYSWTAFGH